MIDPVDTLAVTETDRSQLKVEDRAREVRAVPPSAPRAVTRADCKARATEVAEIFRQLAKYFSDQTLQKHKRLKNIFTRLSNQVTQDTEIHVREERKLQIYSELSSTLSRISTNGATSVMPNLADIMLKNAERKQKVDENFKSIAGLWEQAFEIFVKEISHVLNNQLDHAVNEIRQTGDSACSSLVAGAAATLERQRAEISGSSSSDGYRRERSGSRRGRSGKERERRSSRKEHSAQPEQKRRRYAARSPSPTETRPAESQPLTEAELSLQEILSQMKSKIDQQAQSLQQLTKENHEVKSRLAPTLFLFPCTPCSDSI